MSFFHRRPPPPPVMQIEAERAAKTLDLPSIVGISKELVRTAFRFRVRNVHPDTAGAVDVDVARVIQDLTKARETLLRWIEELPNDQCPRCKGKEWVLAGGMMTKPCPLCTKDR